jgi:hypothetical protein
MAKAPNPNKLHSDDFQAMFPFFDTKETDYPGLQKLISERFAENQILFRICSSFASEMERIETGKPPAVDMQAMVAKTIVSMMIMVGRIAAAKVFLEACIERWDRERFLEADTMLTLSGENVERLDVLDRPWLDYQVHDRKAKTTFLLFCGLANRFGVEINSVALWLRSLPVNLIYIRDYNKKLYLSGIQALGELDETIVKVKQDLAAMGTERVICMGNSGGVYGALYYAHLLKADGVLCFAGPTSLEAGLMEASERPVYADVQALIEQGVLKEPDLRQCYQENGIPVRYFYGKDYEFDAVQVKTIENLPNISIEPLRGWERHIVIGELARRNQLRPIFADAADVTLKGLNRAGNPVT